MHRRGRCFVVAILLVTGFCWLWSSWHVWPGNGYTPSGTSRGELAFLARVGCAVGCGCLLLGVFKAALGWFRFLLLPLGLAGFCFAGWVMAGDWPVSLRIASLVYGAEPVVFPTDTDLLPHKCLFILGAIQALCGLSLNIPRKGAQRTPDMPGPSDVEMKRNITYGNLHR